MIIQRSAAGTCALTTAAAKAHLRVDHSDEDTLIASLAQAAHNVVAQMTGRVLTEEEWTVAVSSVAGDLALPLCPVRSLDAISYYDAAGDAQSLDVAGFWLFAHPDRPVIRPKPGTAWPALQPREDALTVTVTAGLAAVPDELVTAMKLLVGHYYANREAVVTGYSVAELPLAVADLCSLHQSRWVAA